MVINDAMLHGAEMTQNNYQDKDQLSYEIANISPSF